MEVVIDSNVLFRILISEGTIIEVLFDPSLSVLAPKKLKEEFAKHRSEILSRTRLSEKEFNKLVEEIFKIIKFISLEEYESFIPEAKKLLKTHTKDEDFIALCLSKGCKLWTYEPLLFSIGFGVTTKQLSESLA